MALHTLGTKGTTQLSCLAGWSQILLPADMGALKASITDDFGFASLLGGFSAGTSYVLATATTAGTVNLTALSARAGSPPLTQIDPGSLVLGSAADIAPGTFVVSSTGTTAVLSKAAVSSGTLKAVAFITPPVIPGLDETAQLFVPNRGVLRILPGDVVAIDSSGWPVLISANSIAYAGSDWTFT